MKRTKIFTLIACMAIVASSCRDDEYIEELGGSEPDKEVEAEPSDSLDIPSNDTIEPSFTDTLNYPDWEALTHSKAADPNYEVVFAQNSVLRMDIAISASDWSDMKADLSKNLGSSGGMGGNFGGMGGNPGGMGGGMESSSDFTPIWVQSTVHFNDKDWYEVGIRFKGNSSLQQTYSSGNEKFSLKLDFDQFEDEFPSLKNQRFYGFKQLNLNNNYNDQSLMREKVAADLFRQFGIAAAHTTFCEVYIDRGAGAEYFGLYTLVEEVDDTVLDTQFSDGGGNLYKPENDAASFKLGSYNTSDFNLKTNEDVADYSDVRALYDVLHSATRTSHVEEWCAQLESLFHVDHFLKWLAANTVIQNWDTYGNMTHNYYIYTNPADQRITWIPWDNNEAFQSGRNTIEVDGMSRVSSSWPLISYLFDVPAYEEIYKGYLRAFVDEVFVVSDMQTLYTQYYNLLQTFAYAEESGRTFITYDTAFDNAVSTLKSHVQSRNSVVNNYLGDQ